MRKLLNHALVLLLALAMLLCFTACDDDDDDDGLSEKQIINVAAAALGSSVTSGTATCTGLSESSSNSDNYDATVICTTDDYATTYSTWVVELDPSNSYDIESITVTASSDYECYVNGSYNTASSGKYSVTVKSGSTFYAGFSAYDYAMTASITVEINGDEYALEIEGCITDASPVSAITINGSSASTTTANSGISSLVSTIQTFLQGDIATALTTALSSYTS